MTKAKETIEELRSKLFERKKQEVVDKAEEVLHKVEEKLLSKEVDTTDKHVVYDIAIDPNRKGRAYLMVKIEYDVVNNTANIVETKEFYDKTVALGILVDKDNRKYLFNKGRKNENK